MKRFELIEHTADMGLVAYGHDLAEAGMIWPRRLPMPPTASSQLWLTSAGYRRKSPAR